MKIIEFSEFESDALAKDENKLHLYTDDIGIPYEKGQRPRPRTLEDDEFDTKLFKELDLVLAKDETKLHLYTDDTGIPYEKDKNPFPRTDRDDEIEAAFIKEFRLALDEDED